MDRGEYFQVLTIEPVQFNQKKYSVWELRLCFVTM
jgi:hypothetical protein